MQLIELQNIGNRRVILNTNLIVGIHEQPNDTQTFVETVGFDGEDASGVMVKHTFDDVRRRLESLPL